MVGKSSWERWVWRVSARVDELIATMLMVDSAAEARVLKRSVLAGGFLSGSGVAAGGVGNVGPGVGGGAVEGFAGACIEP